MKGMAVRCGFRGVCQVGLSERCASAIRFSAMAKYVSSRSMPINLRPRFIHATPVVPLWRIGLVCVIIMLMTNDGMGDEVNDEIKDAKHEAEAHECSDHF